MVILVQNKEDLEKRLVEAGEKLVVIDFFATWCGPCKIVAPKLDELAIKYKEQAIALKVDVDECEDIAIAYKVISMPTFVFIKNQKIIDMFVGGNTDKLVKMVEKYVGDGKAESEATGSDAAAATAAATTPSAEDSEDNGDQQTDEDEGAMGGVTTDAEETPAVPQTIASGAAEEAQQAVQS